MAPEPARPSEQKVKLPRDVPMLQYLLQELDEQFREQDLQKLKEAADIAKGRLKPWEEDLIVWLLADAIAANRIRKIPMLVVHRSYGPGGLPRGGVLERFPLTRELWIYEDWSGRWIEGLDRMLKATSRQARVWPAEPGKELGPKGGYMPVITARRARYMAEVAADLIALSEMPGRFLFRCQARPDGKLCRKFFLNNKLRPYCSEGCRRAWKADHEDPHVRKQRLAKRSEKDRARRAARAAAAKATGKPPKTGSRNR